MSWIGPFNFKLKKNETNGLFKGRGLRQDH
jgi:hypothetical protein